MTCPRCSALLAAEASACAECGLSLFRNVSGVVKTSIVMISTGDDDESSFYPSVQEVPEPLRKQLLASTSGDNAGTILIADRAGKEHLTQGMARRLASAIGNAARAPGEVSDATEPPPPAPEAATATPPRWLAWGGLVIVLALGLLFVLFFGLRW